MEPIINKSPPIFESWPLTKIYCSSKCPEYTDKYGQGSELDTGYRILADHARYKIQDQQDIFRSNHNFYFRMITVCLADKVFPDHNHKLKEFILFGFQL